jgi:catechol 2,3-dioxygenase-like lactoylglutathione lyase family enzyme
LKNLRGGNIMGAIVGIHHLCINTPDIQKSLTFYCDIIGFGILCRETCAFGEYAMLGLSGSKIELIMPDNPDENSFGNRGSLAHFGLQVENIDEVYESLKQKGVHFLTEKVNDYAEPMGGFRAVSLLGPGGEAINLYEFKHEL